MVKKVLMLAAKANMIQQFNHRNIKILQDLGYEVHVATNMIDFGSMSTDENERLKLWMNNNNVIAHQVDFERRLGSVRGNIRSIRQLRNIFKNNQFSFVHVHSPLGSILGRLVAKQFKVPTIYTAHGFHFFKGGPKRAWLVIYPLEWIFSFFTDTLVTINNQDYLLAEKHMHSKKVVQIHGIGVDVKKAWKVTQEEKNIARLQIRKELNIPDDAFLISSVGELSDKKNHRIVLEAIKSLSVVDREKIYYIIAGTGTNGDMLVTLANNYNFIEHFKLLGYRSDVHNINYASDISIFPSLREGLGIAGLDAVIDGTYLLGTNRGGVSDYIVENSNGKLFNPLDYQELGKLLKECLKNNYKISKDSLECLSEFDVSATDSVMKKVYKSI